MRIIKYLLLTICVGTVNLVSAQWELIRSHVDYEPTLAVTDEDNLYALAYESTRIYKSNDGGNVWNYTETIYDLGHYMSDMDFPSSNVGYACGGTYFGWYRSIILKTTDAGLSWDSISVNEFADYTLDHIEFFNADTGFVSGDFGGIHRTFDGGETFEELVLNRRILDIEFTNNATAFVSAYEIIEPNNLLYSIMKTEDFGETWVACYSGDAPGAVNNRIHDLYFLNDLVGYAVGQNGLFLKTTNGGQTWFSISSGSSANITSVVFTSEQIGYTNRNGGIFKTSDWGNTWHDQEINASENISKICFANDSVGFAVGEVGIYKTTNAGGPLGISETMNELTVQLYPNPANNMVFLEIESTEVDQLEIYDITGKLVLRQSESIDNIDVSKLQNGTYQIVMITPNSRTNRLLVIAH